MAMYTAVASPSIPNESTADTEENTISIDVRESCLKAAKHDPCPFKLRWSFGINVEVPVINLTWDNCTLLAYACSHVTMIYDYSSRTVSPLQGHVGIRLILRRNVLFPHRFLSALTKEVFALLFSKMP
ncbi:cilia- and flagella-associated protein 251-like [Odontomachus brunneus]|uniref:cilia- and flagella-associated protein 251-like n=1 Tax=Odontomachus brunneus TaxID=486640 RepID=UPI0013F2B0CC|nr:cilia- and flagella-associated protein 251-like [Odontomachus brunneus]